MGKLEVIKNYNNIQGLSLITPQIFYDNRGYFLETYSKFDLYNYGDIDTTVDFVQDNESYSEKDVLRGLHYQKKYPQAKLIRVIQGQIYDVAVDLRPSSSSYKKWAGVYLSDINKQQLYIPQGFAHGFLVISDTAKIAYKCDQYYYPNDQYGIIWNDKTLNIDWPIYKEPILSEKDKNLPSL